MKYDRELLELAAKAAGYGNIAPGDDDGVFVKDGRVWNPLNNDGDALRLSVDLNLTLFPIGGGDSTGKAIGCRHEFTRRAIVLAAAEIGRGMP